MKHLVLASGNSGKVREISQLLAGFDLEVVPQSKFNITEIEETGLTFVENAILKARNAAKHSGLAVIADDSGLEVDALGGAPGIDSSRYAGADADDKANLKKLITDLADTAEHQRQARFQCVIVYMEHHLDPTPIICQGTWEGSILHEPRGQQGFGYDPIFFVPSHQCSSAELPADEKNRISHRSRALAKLTNHLQHLATLQANYL